MEVFAHHCTGAKSLSNGCEHLGVTVQGKVFSSFDRVSVLSEALPTSTFTLCWKDRRDQIWRCRHERPYSEGTQAFLHQAS